MAKYVRDTSKVESPFSHPEEPTGVILKVEDYHEVIEKDYNQVNNKPQINNKELQDNHSGEYYGLLDKSVYDKDKNSQAERIGQNAKDIDAINKDLKEYKNLIKQEQEAQDVKIQANTDAINNSDTDLTDYKNKIKEEQQLQDDRLTRAEDRIVADEKSLEKYKNTVALKQKSQDDSIDKNTDDILVNTRKIAENSSQIAANKAKVEEYKAAIEIEQNEQNIAIEANADKTTEIETKFDGLIEDINTDQTVQDTLISENAEHITTVETALNADKEDLRQYKDLIHDEQLAQDNKIEANRVKFNDYDTTIIADQKLLTKVDKEEGMGLYPVDKAVTDTNYTQGEKNLVATIPTLAKKDYVDEQVAPKADTTYVDEKVAPKADTTYVDSELLKKADKSELGKKQDLLSQQQLDNIAAVPNKAEKSEVPTLVSQLDNDKQYQTLNEVNVFDSQTLHSAKTYTDSQDLVFYEKLTTETAEKLLEKVGLTTYTTAIAKIEADIKKNSDNFGNYYLKTDVYTKQEVNDLLDDPVTGYVKKADMEGILNAFKENILRPLFVTQEELEAKLAALGSAIKFKGSVATKADLPKDNNVIGDVWYVKDESVGYLWIEDVDHVLRWEPFGQSIDLSQFLTQEAVVQLTGSSTSKVMSQNAVTNELLKKLDETVFNEQIKKYQPALTEKQLIDLNNFDKKADKTELPKDLGDLENVKGGYAKTTEVETAINNTVANYLPLSGGTLTGNLTAKKATVENLQQTNILDYGKKDYSVGVYDPDGNSHKVATSILKVDLGALNEAEVKATKVDNATNADKAADSDKLGNIAADLYALKSDIPEAAVNYNTLRNKPKINLIEISGNKTGADYKLVDKTTYDADKKTYDVTLGTKADTTYVDEQLDLKANTADLKTDLGQFTNNAGYAKTSEVATTLESYLPKSGGTLTGALTGTNITSANLSTSTVKITGASAAGSSYTLTAVDNTGTVVKVANSKLKTDIGALNAAEVKATKVTNAINADTLGGKSAQQIIDMIPEVDLSAYTKTEDIPNIKVDAAIKADKLGDNVASDYALKTEIPKIKVANSVNADKLNNINASLYLTGTEKVNKVWSGTKQEYDAIELKDPLTIYNVTEDPADSFTYASKEYVDNSIANAINKALNEVYSYKEEV